MILSFEFPLRNALELAAAALLLAMLLRSVEKEEEEATMVPKGLSLSLSSSPLLLAVDAVCITDRVTLSRAETEQRMKYKTVFL